MPLGISLPLESWQPANAKAFLYVGRLLAYKGIEDLIKAISLLQTSGRQIPLNIVGKGADCYEAHLRQLVQSKNLGTCVKFLGWKPNSEVRQLMACATCLVVPSRREAFGLVALEGMTIGAPLITSRAGGLAELVSNSCALTFEAGNVKQLAVALRTAADNPSLLRFLADRGRDRALMFEWGQLAPRYSQFLSSVAASNGDKCLL